MQCFGTKIALLYHIKHFCLHNEEEESQQESEQLEAEKAKVVPKAEPKGDTKEPSTPTLPKVAKKQTTSTPSNSNVQKQNATPTASANTSQLDTSASTPATDEKKAMITELYGWKKSKRSVHVIK